jgi:hypothetical protein
MQHEEGINLKKAMSHLVDVVMNNIVMYLTK